MRVHPEIDALRIDDTPQRDAQNRLFQAHEEWAQNSDSTAIFVDLARFAQGAELAQCPELAGLFTSGGNRGAIWVHDLIRAMAQTLSHHPLGQVPLRHFTNGITSSLLLGRSGETTLALVSVDGTGLAAQSPSPAVNFAPLETHEHILAGYAQAELVGCDQAGLPQVELKCENLSLSPGSVMIRDGAKQALRLCRIDGTLVSLRLQRRPRRGGVSHAYCLSSGRLLHRAAGVMRESRHALMINLLGRMGRRDALPVLTEMACEQAGDDLRWQAVREGLGLDTAQGFQTLCAIADRQGDSLSHSARTLRDHLVRQYPMLADMA